MSRFSGEYPSDWSAIAKRVKDDAGWRCVRCGHPHEPASGHTLTVHHLDNNKSNINWDNLVSLCQKCHLVIQPKVIMDRPWMLDHSEWFKPFAGSHFARKYLGLNLSREEVEANLDFYVALEKNTLQATEHQQVR
jgi:hypothetical protein